MPLAGCCLSDPAGRQALDCCWVNGEILDREEGQGLLGFKEMHQLCPSNLQWSDYVHRQCGLILGIT